MVRIGVGGGSRRSCTRHESCAAPRGFVSHRSAQHNTRARRRRLSTRWSRSTLTPPTKGAAQKQPRWGRQRDESFES
jgi:hypothetical protein